MNDVDLRPGARMAAGIELVARVDDRGEGEAWKARDPDFTHRLSLVKLLAPLPEGAGAPAELLELPKRLRAVREPALLAPTGAGMAGRRPWVASAWFDGVSLASTLRVTAVPTAAIAHAFDALCAAVQACHGAGVVHGRITPGCALARLERGALEVRLTDFGLAGRADQGDAASFADCAPPEGPSVAGDVFGLAATLRYALAAPEDAPSWVEPGGVSRGRADVPAAVWSLLDRATAASPGDRPTDVASLREGLALSWGDEARLPVMGSAPGVAPEVAVAPAPEVASPPPIWTSVVKAPDDPPTAVSPSVESDDDRRTTFKLPALPGAAATLSRALASAPSLDTLLGDDVARTVPDAPPSLRPSAPNPWATEVLSREIPMPHAPSVAIPAAPPAPGPSAPLPTPPRGRPAWVVPMALVAVIAALAAAFLALR